MLNLKEIDVSIDQLFLDPNNPRYADMEDIINPVPDEKLRKNVYKKELRNVFLMQGLRYSN